MSKVRAADWATGFFGVALIGLLWAPWFHYWSVPQTLYSTSGGRGAASPDFFVRHSLNAWQSMTAGDVILLIAGLLAIWLVIATAVYSTAAVSIVAAVATCFAGAAAFVAALVRVSSPPRFTVDVFHFTLDSDLAIGSALGLLATAGLTLSALASMRDERRSAPALVPITELATRRAGGEGSGA